ncbi:MAG: hypothetical protein M3285_10645 [Actinomycetota bacterium]|nr:hypothetical protein [Actinomycetota bacterium]
MARRVPKLLFVAALVAALVFPSVSASATPVCTDGFKGGPDRALCGGRVFAEVENSVDYVQYLPDPTGFREYEHGLKYLEKLYPRWISTFTLSKRYKTKDAVSAGPDRIRSTSKDDTGDGYDIFVAKLTDHKVRDKGKQTLLFSLSVHGDEKGGIEGGVRSLEDLAIAAEEGSKITDGIKGYKSTTGRKPAFHSYSVREVLKKEVVYFVDFNIDGWAVGDRSAPRPGLYTRGNYMGTDLNRQMPTIGRINPSRNPLEETEMKYGHRFMKEVAKAGVGNKMAYGADIHGESQSRAFVDIMYPAGQFDSVKHRQMMAIAERTKSVLDATLYEGLVDALEEATGGDAGEGIEDTVPVPANTVPTKPARWGTVWDTLGYTDTGFIGDYLASELGVTGMDYEIAFNHADTLRPYGRPWSVVLQENYVNATRGIVKTAMAYALYQEKEFNKKNVHINPKGRVGYVFNPKVVTHKDGVGIKPGPSGDGFGANGKKIKQAPYRATNMTFFKQESKYIKGGFDKVLPADIARSKGFLNRFDSLVLADFTAPKDAKGRKYKAGAYLSNIKRWVQRGGNLVLTDRALHALKGLGVVGKDGISDILVYQPYANFTDFGHPMLQGLRRNARQLVEATLVGYGIGASASPMTVVDTAAWEKAGGHVVGTTAPGVQADDGSQTSVGELKLGKGRIRILGGALPTPTESQDHRYGLKDYALTYSGLFIIENSIVHDAPGLGRDVRRSHGAAGSESQSAPTALALFGLLPLFGAAGIRFAGNLRRH